jgi:hypothetical protein
MSLAGTWFSFIIASSQRIAIAIGSGDYPHIRQICIGYFPHAVDRAPCNTNAKDRTPILQFSSVYKHAEILPHMIAMPMVALHLPCFVEWAKTRTVCSALSGDLEFGGDVDSTTTSFEVRGDVPFLSFRPKVVH